MSSRSKRPPVTVEAHLRRLLAGEPRSRRYQWPQILGIVEAVTAKRTSAREVLLRQVALYQGTLRFDPIHGMPHAMPPEDVLRCIAVEALGRWNARKHRAVIQQVADHAEREMVAEIARAALRSRADPSRPSND